MAKRLAAWLIVMCFALSGVSVFAREAENTPEEVSESVEITQEEPTEPTVLDLSLQDAIDMALEENPQLLANDAQIKSAELNLEIAKEAKKKIDDIEKYVKIAVRVSEGLETGYLKHGYYLDAARVGVDLAKMEKDKIIATISYNVTQKYYNVKLMENLVEIAKTGVGIAIENRNVVKKNFDLGYVSQLEVTNVDNAVLKAEHSLENYERNLAIAVKDLKIALGIEDNDCVLILTDDITIPALCENVDELIASAPGTRYDCTALKKSYDLAARYFEITTYYVGDSTAMYHSAYSSYLSSKYTYENTTKLIGLGLESQYVSIIGAKDNIDVCKNDLEIKEIEYESAKIKYEIGLITNLELTGKMAELDSARVQLKNAEVTYLLAVKKFEYDTTIGL